MYVAVVRVESDMPYVYYVDSGKLYKMTVNQSMVQLVADVTFAAAAAVTGRPSCQRNATHVVIPCVISVGLLPLYLFTA